MIDRQDTPVAPAVEMRGVSKWYGAFQVLDGIDLVRPFQSTTRTQPAGSGPVAALTFALNTAAHMSRKRDQ